MLNLLKKELNSYLNLDSSFKKDQKESMVETDERLMELLNTMITLKNDH